MSVVVLSREEWGADPDLPRRGYHLGPARRTEVFIHHTVMIDDDATVNEWEDLEEVKGKMRQLQVARPDLGSDVPYNMVAFCMTNGELVLCEGRGLGRTGAHATNHNRSALGIAFQGNFERTPLPLHLDRNLADLGHWLRELRTGEGFVNLGTQRPDDGREVFGHRDVKNTLCPGQNLFDRLRLVRFALDDSWQAPGDPVVTPGDEVRVFDEHGALDLDSIPVAQRHAVAVVLDELMQLKRRVRTLEEG